jgi:hypothetical protein
MSSSMIGELEELPDGTLKHCGRVVAWYICPKDEEESGCYYAICVDCSWESPTDCEETA